jgi:lipopolysaccharide/colanic/teichoic acid biosynthesis glycosyltransferase
MKIIVIRNDMELASGSDDGLLRFSLSSKPVSGLIVRGLAEALPFSDSHSPIIWAVPEEWDGECRKISLQAQSLRRSILGSESQVISYADRLLIPDKLVQKSREDTWSILSNGRFVTDINRHLLRAVLHNSEVDVFAMNADPDLLAYREKVRLTAGGKLAGFRRLHFDCAEPQPLPADWPHYVFIRISRSNHIFTDGSLSGSFVEFARRCRASGLRLRAINLAGIAIDLEAEQGLLDLCRIALPKGRTPTSPALADSRTLAPYATIMGNVLLGENTYIGPKAVIIGPTIIADNVQIGEGSIIDTSIIGQDVCIEKNQLIRERVISDTINRNPDMERPMRSRESKVSDLPGTLRHWQSHEEEFRTWPRFSYVRLWKRIADIATALIVLILFAPIMPLIALAIKLTSPGPLFYKDRRQGLHGKSFNCFKFRTMITGADKIQEKLRIVSQVDGPQFKMKDDPRLNAVGNFLRETYIDEIPQFFNVLLGQMSVVGPRPSPESENILCPSWRDVRLSVRPGITGLWQICRTREPLKDFQEWIYYDTKYVKHISLKTDLWICWQTVKKLFENIISQF